MIESLEDIIKKSETASIIDGVLRFEDFIPYESEEIDQNNEKYNMMRYLEGLMTEDEHRDIFADTSNDCDVVHSIYNKYIFNDSDIFLIGFTIDDEDIDNIIICRMLLSSDSPHVERFDQLVLRIFFEREETRLAGLVKNLIGEKYAWAESYIKEHSEHKRSFIYQNNTEKYNKLFGIDEKFDEVKNNDNCTKKIKEEFDNDDWILQKFGG